MITTLEHLTETTGHAPTVERGEVPADIPAASEPHLIGGATLEGANLHKADLSGAYLSCRNHAVCKP